MTGWVEHVALSGRTLRVRVGAALPAEPATLAVASALRVFERFPALDTLVLSGAEGEVPVSRSEVEEWLAPEGLAGLQDRGRWPQLLARAVQRRARAAAGDRA